MEKFVLSNGIEIDAENEEEAKKKYIESLKISKISTDGKIITKMYLHGSKESNYEEGKELGLSKEALNNFCYALYEVEFDVEVDIKTGDTKILTVDGRKLI